MKKHFFSFGRISCVFMILTFVLITSIPVKAQVQFQKSFSASATGGGSPAITTGKCAVKQTSDGGYIIAGTTTLGSGSTDIILIKTDELGDTTWVKTYGGAADNEYGHDVIQTSDGGYLTVGKSYSFGPGWYDAYFIKTDSVGGVLWTQAIGGVQNDVLRSVVQTPDGGYVAVGEGETFGAGGLDIYMIKLNAAGTLLWTKTFGGAGTEYGYSIKHCFDNGFIIAGYTGSFGVNMWDMYLLKTDSSGNLQWSRTYGAPTASSDERAYAVVQTADSGYVMTGYSNALGTGGNWDVLTIKTNAAGNLLWANTYGNSGVDIGNDIMETSSGDLIICGQYGAASSGLMLSTDKDGIIQWAKRHGPASYGNSFSVSKTTGGGIAMLGREGNSFYLVKTKPDGISGCNDSIVSFTMSLVNVVSGTGGTTASGGTAVTTNTQVTKPVFSINTNCVTTCPLPTAGFTWSANQNTVVFNNNSTTGTYSWNFGDGSPTSSATDPVHTYTSNNFFIACLTVSDSCGIVTFCDSIPIISTGIQSGAEKLRSSIYPNPVNHESRLEFNNHAGDKYRIEILDISGRIIEIGSTNNDHYIIKKGDHKSGFYFYDLINETTLQKIQGKFIFTNSN